MRKFKYKRRNTYSKIDIGYVYILKLFVPLNSKVTIVVYKIGFTSRPYLTRVSEYKMKNEIVAVFEGSAFDAYKYEQFIHTNHKASRYIFDRDIKFSGKTECYQCIVGISLLTQKMRRLEL